MGRWSPLFCCCLFYNFRTGTRILLHLEIVQYIIVGAVLHTLNFVANELKSFFATHTNRFYEAFEEHKTEVFRTFIFSFIVMFMTVMAGIIAFRKKNPVLLIPYLVYSIFKTILLGLLAKECYSRRHQVMDKHNNITDAVKTLQSELGFYDANNTEGVPITKNISKFAIHAISGLLIAVAISNIHFIVVILKCIYDMFRKNKEEHRNSTKSKSKRTDV